MKILDRITFSVAAAALVFFSAGCLGHGSGNFENTDRLRRYKPYPFPVKFRVGKIEVESKKGAAVDPAKVYFFKPTEIEKWRAGLVKYYPELFAASGNDALTVNFFVYPDYKTAWQMGSGEGAWFMLSLLTMGIVPCYANKKAGLSIYVQTGEVNAAMHTEVRLRHSMSAGFLGLILPTHFLLPTGSGAMFENYSKDNATDHTVNDDKLKEFLGVFVAALHQLPEDRLLKFYLSRQEGRTTLLE